MRTRYSLERKFFKDNFVCRDERGIFSPTYRQLRKAFKWITQRKWCLSEERWLSYSQAGYLWKSIRFEWGRERQVRKRKSGRTAVAHFSHCQAPSFESEWSWGEAEELGENFFTVSKDRPEAPPEKFLTMSFQELPSSPPCLSHVCYTH